MIGMTCTRLAMAGAALLFAVATTAPSGAAPVGPAATQSFAGTDRQHRARRTLLWPILRLRALSRLSSRRVRVLLRPDHRAGGGYYDYCDCPYGYGYGGTSCYRICRDYHGPDYCRYYWRRYC